MLDVLSKAELFDGFEEDQLARLVAIAKPRSLRAGEYLFLLGDPADRLYVVSKGHLEICFPLSLGGTIKDLPVEERPIGSALGSSALVKPHRFTLSARTTEPSEVAAFSRTALLELFETEPRIAYHFMRRIAEMVGHRLHKMQALWARELQRAVAASPGP